MNDQIKRDCGKLGFIIGLWMILKTMDNGV